MSEYAGSGFGSQAKRRATLQRTRRFAAVGVVMAAVGLFIGTAVTFTTENASSDVAIVSNPAIVKVITRGTALPTDGTTPPTKWVSNSVTTGVSPVWTPILNNAVGVTTLGDIALIDTRGLGSTVNVAGTNPNVLINFAMTNAALIDAAHNYFLLPVNLKVWDKTSAWVDAKSADADANPLTGGTAFPTQYLSPTNGYLQFTVDVEGVYEISIPTGGSIFAVSTTNSSNLSPTFLVTTTPA